MNFKTFLMSDTETEMRKYLDYESFTKEEKREEGKKSRGKCFLKIQQHNLFQKHSI